MLHPRHPVNQYVFQAQVLHLLYLVLYSRHSIHMVLPGMQDTSLLVLDLMLVLSAAHTNMQPLLCMICSVRNNSGATIAELTTETG